MSYRISLCIVCMNRTEHLKKTLPRNLADNVAYDNLEFVLLDYGSKDDLYDWAREELDDYVKKGMLAYSRTTEPSFFHMSHAKNMAFRLATGDILCSIDADNYTGPGFAAYVNRVFNTRENMFMAPPRIGPERKWWDVQGRLCLKRDDFYTLRGYDEQIMDYGYEDQDFKSRLRSLGKKKVLIRNEAFLHAITHDDCLRVAENISAKKTRQLFITTGAAPEVLYLQHDNMFEWFRVKNNVPDLRSMCSGKYEEQGNNIRLFKESGETVLLLDGCSQGPVLSGADKSFCRITSEDLRSKILLERAIGRGRQILQNNKRSGNIVNPAGFGQGHIYRNFSNTGIQL